MPENEDTTYYAARAKNEKLERLVEELKQRLEVQHRLNHELMSERDGLAESLNSLLGSSNERAEAQRDQIRELEASCVDMEMARDRARKQCAEAEEKVATYQREAASCAAEAVSARHDADRLAKLYREADARARKWRRAFKALVRGLR